ncbi:MAG: DUF1553 domain-containing protein [Planctomycetota bacterium]|nr:MAG: DUF1553 domain-containing protein [Planctomycetota bacterium]
MNQADQREAGIPAVTAAAKGSLTTQPSMKLGDCRTCRSMRNLLMASPTKIGRTRPHRAIGCLAALVALLGLEIQTALADTSPSPRPSSANVTSRDIAAEVDRRLFADIAAAREASTDDAAIFRVGELTDDVTFLRRVYLDALGRPPRPTEIRGFLNEPSPKKRIELVERLVEDPRFGANWANYWRDVILARRTDNRALVLVNRSVQKYFTTAINENHGWDDIARAVITATGNVREHGEVALILAQQGKAAETASEVSRVFLGIQISCAQCHDHPTDPWKREQFHELAAFFPRVRVRPEFVDGQRSFKLVGRDFGPRRPRVNKKGRKRPPIEHYMPALEDPAADGTRVGPRFFLTGSTLPLGTPDAERRGQLADWIITPSNRWFARAYVNRMWAELVGWGFYEPVDDLGPGRDADALATLDYLSAEFVSSGHDMKWLFRTIASTEAYGRESRSRDPAGRKQLGFNSVQPLRGDVLFDALVVALNLPDELAARGTGLASLTDKKDAGEAADEMEMMETQMNERQRRRRRLLGGPRGAFQLAFGYDPSLPREDVKASIPQALAMMNAPQINRQLRAHRRNSLLREITATVASEGEVITELYLRCLSRAPTVEELDICVDYVDKAATPAEAFEDLQWSLINSTEFRYRK